MRVYSIEFDEYEKAALLNAIEDARDRLVRIHNRIYLASADLRKVVLQPPGPPKVDRANELKNKD